jgi:hypothetical protein
VNLDSGLGRFAFHIPPESVFTISRNPYSPFSGTLIHMPRIPQQQLFPEIQAATEALEKGVALTEVEIAQIEKDLKAKKVLVHSCRKGLAALKLGRASSLPKLGSHIQSEESQECESRQTKSTRSPSNRPVSPSAYPYSLRQ